MNNNNVEKAIVAFEKQVKVDPNNANSFDSLCDGYKVAGRIDDAVKQYKKGLEINPEFSPSIKNLRLLKNKSICKKNGCIVDPMHP